MTAEKTTILERIHCSGYLTPLLEKNPQYAEYYGEASVVTEAQLQGLCEEVQHYPESLIEDTTLFGQTLLTDKGRFSLLWSIAYLSRSLSFEALGKWQSEFAQRCVQQALNAALSSAPVRKLYRSQAVPDAESSGLFILALGKLGGFDLNFSSDIDLIAFYDKERFVCPRMQGATYVVTQILQSLNKVLMGDSAEQLIWRVDWRLRPHASLRNLSMPMQSADEFYHYHARPWHRLAMLKARVIAGDADAGGQFLQDLRPFLWRHDLDYRALDDLESLKHKINREHPELKQQREQDGLEGKALEQMVGFNLKLGHGGIREIEFLVNALQLIWGGRRLELRQTQTLSTLACLSQLGLMEAKQADELGEAYVFLRTTENALQMLDNKQVYHLPSSSEQQAKLLDLLSIDGWRNFEQQLKKHRQQVSTAFAALFAGDATSEQPSINGVQQTSETVSFYWQQANLSEHAQQVVSLWREGFVNYGVHESYARSLVPLAKKLDEIIYKSQLDTEEAIKQIDAFFHRLPPGGQYFRLLKEHPSLLEKLVPPLLLSPAMQVLLSQSPHIIDCFLEGAQALQLDQPLNKSVVFYTDDFELRLENLRRVANEELYLLYLEYFEKKDKGQSSARQLEAKLSYLAQRLLDIALQVTADELGVKTIPIAVIGFGKLGMGAMMPNSDLDLVFIFDDIKNIKLASQFTSKLSTVLSVPMKQGRVYELDTRLRPSGKSGAATMSIESFELHQVEQAYNWSHLALVPAQFVAGDAKLGARFEQIKQAILSRPRDISQYKKDCLKMLLRIDKQRTVQESANRFISKLRPGGLGELEYLICCYAILQYKDKPKEWPESFDMIAALLGEQEKLAIGEALVFMRSLQIEVRLFGHESALIDDLPSAVKQHVCLTLELDNIEQLEQKMQAYTQMTSELRQRFFQSVAGAIGQDDMAQWLEKSVQWLE